MNPGILFVCASIIGVVALSMNRFLALCLHLRYQETVNCLTKCFHFDLISGHKCHYFPFGDCKTLYYSVRLIFVSFFVPFCLLTIALLQCKIYSVVRRHRYEIRAQQVQIKCKGANKMLQQEKPNQKASIHSASLIYLLLLICYLPQSFTDFSFFKSKELIVHRYTATLLFSNSCL